MRKYLKAVKSRLGTNAIMTATVFALPFLGIALLLNPQVVGILVGIAFLAIGLLAWSLSYR